MQSQRPWTEICFNYQFATLCFGSKKTHLLIQTHVEQTGAIQAHPALKEGQQEVKKRNIVHEVWFFDVTQEILM